MSESIVYCEGYYDRAFLAGWLQLLGCRSLWRPEPGSVIDPFNVPVPNRQYAYKSATGHFIRVVPCQTKDEVRPLASNRLKERESKALERLVLVVDADTNADETPIVSVTMSRQSMMDLVRSFDPSMVEEANGSLLIDGGATTVDLIRWETSDPPTDGLPNQQTLERFVCASIAAAYPDRCPHVHQWLQGRPRPPQPSVKEHAWSYMAGWYPERGCDAFYGLLWQDPPVAVQLEARLRDCGAWQIAAALAH